MVQWIRMLSNHLMVHKQIVITYHKKVSVVEGVIYLCVVKINTTFFRRVLWLSLSESSQLPTALIAESCKIMYHNARSEHIDTKNLELLYNRKTHVSTKQNERGWLCEVPSTALVYVWNGDEFICVTSLSWYSSLKYLLPREASILHDRSKYCENTVFLVRGSFQKFCTLYVFSLKINLFYKIHLQAINPISIVLYHSGPTFGQVLYSNLNAFVVDASDYSGHLNKHLFNASEAFPTEWFLQFWEQIKVWWAEPTTKAFRLEYKTFPNVGPLW
jgi:hypothetical protein